MGKCQDLESTNRLDQLRNDKDKSGGEGGVHVFSHIVFVYTKHCPAKEEIFSSITKIVNEQHGDASA